MMRQDKSVRLWEQDGDLDLMRKFYAGLPRDREKERIRQMVLAKLDQDEAADTTLSAKGVLDEFVPSQQRPSVPTRIRGTWQRSWQRWGWKMSLPVAAVVLLVMIGQAGLTGMSGLTNLFPHGTVTEQYQRVQSKAASPSTSNNVASPLGGNLDVNGVYDSAAAPSAGGARQNAARAPQGSPSAEVTKGLAAGSVPPPHPTAASLPRKITHNLEATLQVDNPAQAVEKLNKLAKNLGGYTVSSKLNNSQNDSDASAQVTIKVPADKFDGISDSLASIGKVLSQNVTADDISNQYYDTDTRLQEWQAEERRYLDILQKARTVNDIMQVESFLSNIRMQIEQLKGQLKLWDNQVAFSTIKVQLQSKPNPIKVNEPWQPVAWHTTWVAGKNAVIKTISVTWNLLNYLVVGIGYLLPFMILGGAGYWGYRKFRKK